MKSITCVLVITVGSLAHANDYIDVTDGGCTELSSQYYEVEHVAGNIFDVTLVGDAPAYSIRPAADNISIRRLSVEASADAIVRVLASCNDPAQRFISIESIEESDLYDDVAEYLLEKVDIDGNLGNVRIERIGDILLRYGDITGEIRTTTPDNPD